MFLAIFGALAAYDAVRSARIRCGGDDSDRRIPACGVSDYHEWGGWSKYEEDGSNRSEITEARDCAACGMTQLRGGIRGWAI